jgi:uncharacterized protein YlxW (UPF0749 family)
VKRRVLLATVAALLAVLLASVVAMAVFAAFTLDAVREAQLVNTERAKDTEALAEQIKVITADTNNLAEQIKRVAGQIESCTTPKGECYERGRSQTADAVGTINRITIYAAACADRAGVDTAPEIQACIEQALASEDR